jgi:phosphoglycolate phosphatase
VLSPTLSLSASADVSAELARQIEAFESAEIKAGESAAATPGVDEFLAACREAGRRLAIVSNNCEASVRTYLIGSA